ncbi:MAG: recombinase family protein [Oscillospiraceae bacterium]
MLNERFVAGIYCRLSRDDENLSESLSIANQRQILTDYIKEKGWQFTGEYIDDGYTGTNFDRPDFKRMLNDIERGCINCVVTKDLSRLGRNYAMTGFCTEQYFPDHNVRYIAINDGVDTMEEFNDMDGFHNVMN